MTDFNPDEMSTEMVVEQLKTIAQSGQVEIEWTELQRALRSRLETVLEGYKERACGKESQYEEPNVDKFNLEHSRDEILELIASFNEPPFTIQRICELLYSPFKYYDRVSTFFRGLEKNLRVISSNEWPKSQVDQKMNQTTPAKNDGGCLNNIGTDRFTTSGSTSCTSGTSTSCSNSGGDGGGCSSSTSGTSSNQVINHNNNDIDIDNSININSNNNNDALNDGDHDDNDNKTDEANVETDKNCSSGSMIDTDFTDNNISIDHDDIQPPGQSDIPEQLSESHQDIT